MVLDEIVRQLADNEFILTIAFAGAALLVRLFIKKYHDDLNSVNESRKQALALLQSQIDDLKREIKHLSGLLDRLVNSAFRSFKDVIYRHEIADNPEGDVNEWS